MYILIIILSLFIIVRNEFYSSKRSSVRSIIDFVFVAVIVLAGTLRDASVGSDIVLGSGGYHGYWQNPSGYMRDLEPGFRWFTLFVKSISGSYYFYYSLIFALNMLFYYLACWKMKIGFPLFMAILFMAGLLTPSFNIIRQMLGLSVGLFLYSMLYYNKAANLRNILIYEVAILLCGYLIHTSVIMLGLIPIFEIPAVGKLFSKTWFLALVAVGCVLLSEFGINQITYYVLGLSGVFGERADAFINVVDTFGIDRSHGFITDAINFVLIIFISKDIRNNLLKIGFLGYALSCLGAAALGTISRAFDNLVIFACLYYAQNWKNFIPLSKFKVATVGAMFFRIVFWLTSLYYTVLLNESINPYKTYLF